MIKSMIYIPLYNLGLGRGTNERIWALFSRDFHSKETEIALEINFKNFYLKTVSHEPVGVAQ
jgi:hypothetical protein